MANDWYTKSLADLIEIIGGGTPKTSVTDYWNGEIPWLSVVDFNTDNRWVSKTEKHITELGLKESSTVMLRSRDIIISARGTIGAIAQLTRPMAFNQSCYGIRGIDGVTDTDFIYYTLKHAVTGLKKIAHGAVFDTITRDTFKVIEVLIPPLVEQKRIASLLGALDDKIEIIGKINQRLEATARALFQSWFVDFDPVRAKLDGRKPFGIDELTSDLFPDTFQDSELGNIPKGWTIKPVGEVVDCVGGGTPSTAELKYWEGGTHHWTTPKDFSSLQSPILLNTDRKLTDAGIAKISSGLLPAGTLLLSSRAPVGYLAIASMPVAINQGFIALKCNEYASNYFMLNWCQSNMPEIESRATGTTFAEISKQNFRPIRVVLPSKNLMSAFTGKVEPLYEQITANLRQSQTLASLRDTLLPKLLSGELSVENLQP